MACEQGRQAGRPCRRERGSAALSSLFAFGVFMVVFLLFVQVAVWQYTRGALRAAAMEAARAEAPYQAPAGACERRFESTRSALLGGAIAEQVGVASCVVGPEFVTVSVDANLEGWIPISPGWSFTVEAIAVKEHAP